MTSSASPAPVFGFLRAGLQSSCSYAVSSSSGQMGLWISCAVCSTSWRVSYEITAAKVLVTHSNVGSGPHRV